MAGVLVMTDSGADLPRRQAGEPPIVVVPLGVSFGDGRSVDATSLEPAEFWSRCRAERALPTTAAPSIGDYLARFEDAAREGWSAVACVTISSALSGSYQSACAAADAVASKIPVRVIDSRSASIGEALVVLELACRCAAPGAQGLTLESLGDDAERVVDETHVYGVLDTLDHLRRGGRIGAAQALLGSLLSFKPLIEVRAGTVQPAGRQRTRRRSLESLAATVAAHAPVESLLVVHALAPDLQLFLDLLAEEIPASTPRVAELGPIIGTHTGPGTVGVAFRAGPR